LARATGSPLSEPLVPVVEGPSPIVSASAAAQGRAGRIDGRFAGRINRAHVRCYEEADLASLG